jgi:ATP-dependent DNA helicase RecG
LLRGIHGIEICVVSGMQNPSTDIPALVSQGMGASLHWFPEDVPLSRLASTLVGLANADGGTVLLGVSPRVGELLGVKDVDATLELIYQAALLSNPTLVLPIPQQIAVQKPGRPDLIQILSITVPSGLPYVYSLDGRYFGRDGAQTGPLPPRRLHKLLIERGAVQFESHIPPDVSVKDLDPVKVLDYAETIGNVPRGDLNKAHEFLVRRGCLKRLGDELQPTYAAILLFGYYPQQWLPNATLLAGRFPGVVLSDTYIKQDITGTIPEQLQQAMIFISANLRNLVRLVGLQHQETLEYPIEAVRELLVNAMAHRDYNLQGDNIHLYIFADRLEVHSPGTLPGPVTLENLLEARFARNAVITQLLSDLGYVERLGYGLDRVMEVTRQAGLRPPRFEEIAGTFHVTLYASLPGKLSDGVVPDLSAYLSLDLNPRQQMVLAYLAQNQRITSHEYQSLSPDVHSETLRRDMADLVSRGILIKVGDKRATYYILKRV